MALTIADYWLENPSNTGFWWACTTGMGRTKSFDTMEEAQGWILTELFKANGQDEMGIPV